MTDLRAGDEDASRVILGDYKACGVTSLYVACRLTGVEASLAALNSEADPDGDAVTSFEDLERAARSVGLFAVALKLTPKHIGSLPGPAIVQMRPAAATTDAQHHFVVFVGSNRKGLVGILDPPRPLAYWKERSFTAASTGNVLALCRTRGEAATVVERLSDEGASAWTLNEVLITGCILSLVMFVWRPRR